MERPITIYRAPILIGMIVFVVVFALTLGIIYQRTKYYEEQDKRELTNAANLAKEKIKTLLNQGLVATNTLSFIVQTYGVPEDFSEVGKQIIASNSMIDVIELVQGGMITHVYPVAGNEEAIGYNILNDSLRNKEAYKAIQQGKVFYAGPLQLKQGGLAVVGRLPIFKSGNYWGFSAVIIKLSSLIKFAEIDSSKGGSYVYELSKINPDTKKEEFFLLQNGTFNNRNAVKVNISDGDWNIYAKHAGSVTTPFLGALQIFGFLFSLVAGLFSWYIARQPLQLKLLVNEKIGELRSAEKELVESEEKFRTLVEQSLVGVFIMQGEHLNYVSPGFEKITGYNKDQLVGSMVMDDLIHGDDLGVIKGKYLSRMAGQTVDNQSRLRILRSDGSIRHIEIIVSTIIYKEKPAVIGTVLDITQSLEESNRIEQAVIDAQEKERLQIGMELHDNVQQILAAASLNLEFLKSNLSNQPMANEIITNLKKYTSEAILELRRLSQQLAPSIDPSVSLKDKIQALADSMNLAGNLKLTIEIDEADLNVDEKIQLSFFRIIQEQLTNIIKYAETNKVLVSVKKAPGRIILTITDQGKGFDTSLRKKGIGLENIRRRTEFLNGRLAITSSPGKGTKILVEVPVAV